MIARISLLLDGDYTRIAPPIMNGDTTSTTKAAYEQFEVLARMWNWDDQFTLDLQDARLTWLKPPGKQHELAVIGFQWRPADGEVLDAHAVVLPGKDLKLENKYLVSTGVERQVINTLGPRPQVFIQANGNRLKRCPTRPQDGNNRVLSKDHLAGYVCEAMGMMGFVAMKYYWGLKLTN